LQNVEMDILGLSTSPSSGGAYALILNEKDGGRRLPIIIGTFEAQAIALELESIKPPRPMTHDLLKNIIMSFDSAVDYVLINELSEGTFFAKLVFTRDDEKIEIDARPSDAIAVAIRFGASIFVHKSVLDEAGIESAEEKGKTSTAQTVKSSETSELSGIEKLEQDLQMAVETENYEKAAKLRDQIKRLKG